MITRVFSTGDYLPGGSKAGQGFCSNYSCPTGYLLDTSNPSNYLCVKNEYLDCGTIIPTPTPTPTHTPTPTSTPRDCSGCTSYDVVISQSDLDAISGNTDNKIYVYYYPCGMGTQQFVTYSSAGTYEDEICSDNCSDEEPSLYSSFDGGTNPQNSYLIEISGDCSSSISRRSNCATTTVVNTINSAGLSRMLNTFELDQPYGNYQITVSATTNNNTTEIFIGNYEEKVGELFTLTQGFNEFTKTVGYYSSNENKILDIYVFSTNTGTFQPFDLYVTSSCQTTISCDSVSETTETYKQNVVLNVTEAGYIIYNNISGQQSIYATVGTRTIYDCVIIETIKSPLVLLDPATFTITNEGTLCNLPVAGIGDCVDITFSANYGFSATAYWLDCNGNEITRFINSGEIFTTTGSVGSGSGLPVTYGDAIL